MSGQAGWLWSAGSAEGIAESPGDGMAKAEPYLVEAGTGVARVEMARQVIAADLNEQWERTGQGWTGRLGKSGVAWAEMAPAWVP